MIRSGSLNSPNPVYLPASQAEKDAMEALGLSQNVTEVQMQAMAVLIGTPISEEQPVLAVGEHTSTFMPEIEYNQVGNMMSLTIKWGKVAPLPEIVNENG